MTTFRVLTVREVMPADELARTDMSIEDDVHVACDGLVFPVPIEGRNQIASEPGDGDNTLRLVIKCLRITDEHGGGSRKEGFISLDDLSIDVLITDSRVVIACSKFAKGGGWGISALGAALNTVSYTRAALRRRAKSLVGHLRYPWLCNVAATVRQRRNGFDGVRLQYVAPAGQRHGLELRLPPDIDSSAVATEIIRRAAAHRLACETELSDADIPQLRRLTTLSSIETLPGRWVGHELARARAVSEESARLEPAREAPRR